MRNEVKLFLIVSLPRSGSTVLSAEIDRFEQVISLPESYFPLMIKYISGIKNLDKSQLARIFLKSCDAGFILSEGQLAKLIQPDDWRKTWISIGLACAEEIGRNPKDIKAIVWKSTRILSGLSSIVRDFDGIITLQRNAMNVFESQFRVGFGLHNRNALRFAAFKQSYNGLLASLEFENKFEISYESIPEDLNGLIKWMGLSSAIQKNETSTMESTVAKCEWHAGLLDGFQSKDKEKLKSLGIIQRNFFRIADKACILARPGLSFFRQRSDKVIARRILQNGLTE